MSGSYRGTAVPPVGNISYHGYTAPANWQNPAVTGTDLVVHRDVLRQVASELSALAAELQGAISQWHGLASSAMSAVGSWHEAQQLGSVIGRSSSGFGDYSSDLHQAHNDTATRLTVSAERYDTTEQANVSLANASHDPSATIVQSGGNNRPVDPGYGKNWTPAQQQAYYRTQRLIQADGGTEVWNGTFPISEASGFGQAGTGGYTWQQVQSLLEATDPGAISSAGTAYGQLSNKLTEVASKVAAHGQTLASNWGGATALTAVSQIQQLYQTATDMQANAWQAQSALTWYGSVLSAFKTNLPQPASTHPADVAAANKAAQQRMQALNGHIQTTYYSMPGAVNKNLPPKLAVTGGGNQPATGGPGGGTGGPFGGSGAGGSGGPGSSAAGNPGTVGSPGPGGAPLPGSGGVPPAGGPPPGSTLSGTGPPPPAPAPGGPGTPGAPVPGGPAPGGPGPGGVVPPPPVGSPPGGDGVPPPGGEVPPPGGSNPGGPGEGGFPGGSRPGGLPPGEEPLPGGDPVPGGPGGVAPGEPGFSSGGTGPGRVSTGGLAPGETAAGEPGFGAGEPGPGGMDGNMFPMSGGMGGGGAGGSGFDRARQSWMTEEDGTWGPEGALGEAGNAAAGDGFYMPVGPGGGQNRERDRLRQSWMAEDEDLWGALEPAVPPVIGG